jgi:GTP-binding protein
MKSVISIVGRPNVGKSTLFNRIIGYRKAITEDTPGVTRDRNYGEFDYQGESFVLVDTGGFEPFREDGYFPLIKRQIHVSMDESSAIIFVLDGKEGILPQDMDIAKILRRYEKPVIYAINKVDSKKREMDISEFYALGAERLYPISALHGIGIGELLEDIYKATGGTKDEGRKTRDDRFAWTRDEVNREGRGTIRKAESREQGAEGKAELLEAIRIAIVGRPNTGKSSIVNRLLSSERMIVSDIPGTTRDAIDSKIMFRDEEIIIIDTAGLRKKSKIYLKVEEYSVASALHTIERANIVNLIIDANEGASHQDAAIAHLIITKGKGICIVINKWDLVKGKIGENEYTEMIKKRIPHAAFSPVIFTSAKTGKNIEKILEIDARIYAQLMRRISTSRLNVVFEEFFRGSSVPYIEGKQVKISYVNQARILPPTFVLFSNYPRLIPEHYKRYLINCIREKYGFQGAPLRLIFKKK